MLPNDTRHGTYAGWQTHHRERTLPVCEPCRQARATYQRKRAADEFAGKPRRVPVDTVRPHVQALVEAGMTSDRIAELAGVHVHTVNAILHGRRKTTSSDHAAWIRGVTLAPDRHGMVAAEGSTRRLRALARLGWTSQHIAQAAQDAGHKIQPSSLKAIRNRKRPMVRTSSADAIAAAYDLLSMKHAPSGRGINSYRTRSLNLGFAPPLAWDDIDRDLRPKGAVVVQADHKIDESVVLRILDGDHTPARNASVAERREVVRKWPATGRSINDLARLTGWKPERYGAAS